MIAVVPRWTQQGRVGPRRIASPYLRGDFEKAQPDPPPDSAAPRESRRFSHAEALRSQEKRKHNAGVEGPNRKTGQSVLEQDTGGSWVSHAGHSENAEVRFVLG